MDASNLLLGLAAPPEHPVPSDHVPPTAANDLYPGPAGDAEAGPSRIVFSDLREAPTDEDELTMTVHPSQDGQSGRAIADYLDPEQAANLSTPSSGPSPSARHRGAPGPDDPSEFVTG